MPIDKQFINPLTDIKREHLPLVVFSDDMYGFLGWGIKAHTKGTYNHSMTMTVFDKDTFIPLVDTQGWVYKRESIKTYMTDKVRLKFVKLKGLKKENLDALYLRVKTELAKPWYKRRYDFLGIIGQLFHLKAINNPWMSFCSERVAIDLKVAGYKDVPFKPNPSQLNNWMKTKQDLFEVLGYWQED